MLTLSAGLHSGGHVDSVSKQTIARHNVPDNPCDTGARMKTLEKWKQNIFDIYIEMVPKCSELSSRGVFVEVLRQKRLNSCIYIAEGFYLTLLTRIINMARPG